MKTTVYMEIYRSGETKKNTHTQYNMHTYKIYTLIIIKEKNEQKRQHEYMHTSMNIQRAQIHNDNCTSTLWLISENEVVQLMY